MKENLRKLNLCIKLGIFNPDDFYLITVHSYEIVFQGRHNQSLEIDLKMKKLNCIEESNGFLYFERNNIKITLTN